jgi:murein DD-endopeptidase MepM/ murein hydrolase activator NlpD
MGNHRADRRGSGRGASTTPDVGPAAPGRRKAPRGGSARGSLLRGLPSAPVLLGVAALAVSAGGALTAAGPEIANASVSHPSSHASALSGTSSVSRGDVLDARTAAVSRDSRRDALADAADARLVDQAESQARQRNAALAQFAKQAQAQADKIRLNQWVLPVVSYHLTARFGQFSGLWATSHTGLDFAAPEGTPIRAVANGVVTSTGYDGSYGNKTVVTLDDGTELWFCHQSAISVHPGDQVRAGEVIGLIGATGNVTGPHLHLEVRPGGGDPVDPFQALVVHGLKP